MKPPFAKSLLATCVILATLIGSSDAFLDVIIGYFFNQIFSQSTDFFNRVGDAVFSPAQTVLLGGGTEIVTNALTLDALGIPWWEVITTGIYEVGVFAIGAVWWIFTAVVSVVANIIAAVVEGAVTLKHEAIWGGAGLIGSLINGADNQGQGDVVVNIQVVNDKRSVRSASPVGKSDFFWRENRQRKKIRNQFEFGGL